MTNNIDVKITVELTIKDFIDGESLALSDKSLRELVEDAIADEGLFGIIEHEHQLIRVKAVASQE